MERTKKSCSIYNPTGISGIFFGKWKTLSDSSFLVSKYGQSERRHMISIYGSCASKQDGGRFYAVHIIT